MTDSHTETTIIAALVHYGLACYDGSHCVAALRAIGQDGAANVLQERLEERADEWAAA